MIGSGAIASSQIILVSRTYNSDDSWTCPNDCNFLETVDGWGGGGGGGAGRSTQRGGGGASASRSRSTRLAVVPGRTYTIVRGDAGPLGLPNVNSGTPLADGEASQIIDNVTTLPIWQAGGGRRGVGGALGVPGAPGGAGQSGDSIGDTVDLGVAGSTLNGGTAPGGGAGGAGGNPAQSGTAPGGGGGAGSTSGINGSAGGQGQVLFTYFTANDPN